MAFWKNQGDHFQHPYSADAELILARPQALQMQQTQQQRVLLAQTLPTQRFYSRGKTSFSYLAQHLKHKKRLADRLANINTDFEQEDELHLTESKNTATAQPIAWIKQHFPRGTLAGNFLHEIFEQINFQQPHMWVEEIRRRFKNTYQSLWSELLFQYQQHFPEQENSEQQLYQWIADWLGEVLHTPLNQGFQLKQLAAGQYLSECPFYLALSDRVLAMQRVQQLFEEYGIEMPELLEAKSARYLNVVLLLTWCTSMVSVTILPIIRVIIWERSNWIISNLRLQKVCRCRVIGYKQRYILWHYIVICR